MSSETAAQATEAFFTTKEEGKGTGLGLAMVHTSVTEAGGRLTIDSAAGQGTTVRLWLPAATEEIPELPAPHAPASPVAPRILFLEDDPLVRHTIGRILRRDGIEVTEAATVAAAREAMDRGEFDLLLTDAVLPDGDAAAVMRAFRQAHERPIIVCSGYIRDQVVIDGVEAGRYTFLQKPARAEELLATVRRELAKARR